ncbi:hypothetical protein GEMRC1_002907 [Eukaryota sp. GEM-RC1]
MSSRRKLFIPQSNSADFHVPPPVSAPPGFNLHINSPGPKKVSPVPQRPVSNPWPTNSRQVYPQTPSSFQPSSPHPQPTSSKPSTPYSAKPTPAERFGLLGLVSLMKADNQDLSTLALGTDLMQLGLNLNSSDVLYSKFDSPFDVTHKSDLASDIKYDIPVCYYSRPPILTRDHFERFPVETLFYIFYSKSRDSQQLISSEVLVSRGWKYHKVKQLWMKPLGPPGAYTVWDVDQWFAVNMLFEEADAINEDDLYVGSLSK